MRRGEKFDICPQRSRPPARARARVLRTDKHDARDVFMMRVAASILDVRNIEMNGRTFIPRAGA